MSETNNRELIETSGQISSGSDMTETGTVDSVSGSSDHDATAGKSKAQEEFANLHPLRARLYDNVNLSLNTMNIVVALVAIALVVVFIIGVATGSRT